MTMYSIKDGFMIGASIDKVKNFLDSQGLSYFEDKETEFECGEIRVSNSPSVYSDHYCFEIMDGIVDDSYFCEGED